MKRLTDKNYYLFDEDDEQACATVHGLYARLCKIENILGDDYDLDRLREIVGRM